MGKAYYLRTRVERTVARLLMYTLLTVMGISMVLPFLWMVSTSFKRLGDVFEYPPRWIPSKRVVEYKGVLREVERIEEQKGGMVTVRLASYDRVPAEVVTVPAKAIRRVVSLRWENFVEVWNRVPFGRYYFNSLFVAICVTFGQVLTSSMAAYAFARLRFPLRDKLFLGYLATLMIPGAVTMIPVFILLRMMPEVLNHLFSPVNKWWSSDLYFLGRIYVGRPIGIDSYFALIVPGLFSAYGTFLLRQFFMTLPVELEEAAKIDGCSLFGIYWRITLPLSAPAIATLSILTFMGNWRSFMWPLVVTHSKELHTLPVGLASFQGLYTTDWTLLMAASLMALLPVIILYVLLQRYFIAGIRLGAIKG